MAIGSTSLDVNSLVSQLVSNERASYATRLTSREAKATVQLSAVSSLKGALSSFKSAVDSLKTSASLSPRSTTSSDEDVFTASSAGDAATGSYSVRVMSLAKAQQLASDPIEGGSAAVVGTGKMSIKYGDKTFEVDITEDNNTLAGIRNAINKASGNTGVQATLLNDSEGSRLLLTSAKTGAANKIEVTVTGGDGGLDRFAYSAASVASPMTEMQAAKDAHIKIANFDHYHATNTITGAIDGVTINLKTESPDEPVTLNITEDQTALKERVKNFVTAYNSLQSNMGKLRSYDATTRVAGPMLGDSLLRGIEGQIGLNLSNPVEGIDGPYTTLASLGITKQLDGTLKVDDAKLAKALEADRLSVAKVLGGQSGVAARVSTYIEGQLKDGGAIDSRTDNLQANLKTIEKDTEALDARMEVVAARYRKQFTALDTLLQKLQTTSSYLSSQLASISG